MSKAGEQKRTAPTDFVYLCYCGYDRSWSWPVAANDIRADRNPEVRDPNSGEHFGN